MQRNITYLVLILLGFISCSSENKEKPPVSGDSKPLESYSPLRIITKGEVVNPVKCNNDTLQSYAAYLPSNYDSSKKYPLLLCFDAHAGGRIPVEAYKSWAEKYGYILVGSNNSKNGLEVDKIASISTVYKTDVLQKFSIDPNRIYVCGFSGGARVAANMALRGEAQALVSCSAGFPVQENMNFSFIGFAGTEDFNSNEMIYLNRSLDATKIPHQLILFEGKHEWPSTEIFEEAFIWLELSAMKNKAIATNTDLIKNFLASQDKKIGRLRASNNLLAYYRELDKTANFVYGLSDVSALLKERTQLEKTTALKDAFAKDAALEKREMDLQNYYRQAMQQQPISWWFNEIHNLRLQASSKQNTAQERQMIKRCLSFLSLLTYMSVNASIKQNQPELTNEYLRLYEKVDPDNSEVYYLQAQFLAKNVDRNFVFELLNKAIDKGFKDLARLTTDKEFESLRNDSAYLNITEKLKSLN